jgi:hypothetical protein
MVPGRSCLGARDFDEKADIAKYRNLEESTFADCGIATGAAADAVREGK